VILGLRGVPKPWKINLILFDSAGNNFYEATITVIPALREHGDQVSIYSEALLHRYWACDCYDIGWWRKKDEFEGPMPEQTQQWIEQDSVTQSGPLGLV
jgi:hypothetical protein